MPNRIKTPKSWAVDKYCILLLQIYLFLYGIDIDVFDVIRQLMSQLTWLPLRLNLLPVLHKQAQQILDKFLLTRADILQGDILALQTIQHIKQKVQQRIRDIDQFYLTRPLDPRMKYLYGIRTVLVQIGQGCAQFEDSYQKYLINQEQGIPEVPMTKYHQEKTTENYNQHISTPSNSGNLSARMTSKPVTPVHKPNTPIHKLKNSQLQKLQDHNQHLKASDKHSEKGPQMRLSDLRKPKNTKSPQRKAMEEVNRKGTGRKVEGGHWKANEEKNVFWAQNERERKQAALRWQQTEGKVNKSLKDLSQLVFTIKMTKQQYNQFMRLKRKNNHA